MYEGFSNFTSGLAERRTDCPNCPRLCRGTVPSLCVYRIGSPSPRSRLRTGQQVIVLRATVVINTPKSLTEALESAGRLDLASSHLTCHGVGKLTALFECQHAIFDDRDVRASESFHPFERLIRFIQYTPIWAHSPTQVLASTRTHGALQC